MQNKTKETTATRNQSEVRAKYYQQPETKKRIGKNTPMLGNGSYSYGRMCSFHGMWHQSGNNLFRVHRSRQNLHREDLEMLLRL